MFDVRVCGDGGCRWGTRCGAPCMDSVLVGLTCCDEAQTGGGIFLVVQCPFMACGFE